MKDYDEKPIIKALRENRDEDAIRLIRKALKSCPDSHWLWMSLSSAYYELRKYRLAVRYAWKAIDLAPNCTYAIWYYGTALDMMGRHFNDATAIDTAESTFKGLIGFGWKCLATAVPCGEGEFRTKAILNDARYRLALIYFHKQDYKSALRWIKLHLRMRGNRSGSIYSKSQVQKDLQKIEAAKG